MHSRQKSLTFLYSAWNAAVIQSSELIADEEKRLALLQQTVKSSRHVVAAVGGVGVLGFFPSVSASRLNERGGNVPRRPI